MAEMKDSGIEWIGEIPEDWDVIRCKYISTFLNGYAFDSKDLQMDFMYPVIRIGDIKNGGIDTINCQGVNNNYDIKDYLIKENDILLAMSGATVGKVGIAHNIENAYINQRVGIIRTDCPSYLFYCLSTKEFVEYILLCANGSAQPNVSADVYREFSIPLPPKEIKIKIADFLDEKCVEIDTLHSDIEKQIETLEKYKKSIITEAVTKGLDPDVEMKDSGIELIGQIPNEWKISRLGWISKKIGDGIHGTVTFEDGETNFYFINGNNIKKRNIAIKDNTQRITARIYNTYKTNLTTHTILISLNGTIGNLAFYNNENVLLGKSVGFIELKEEYNKEYIYYLLQANYIKTIFELSFAGTTINNLSLQTLRKTNVLLPPKTEQKKIVKYLDKKCAEIDGAIEEKKEQLDTLEQYKKSVIYEYVTGKKEVQ
ncbi:restriction endonuclease subunit S [uncultured Eubacterium sp.]|uniref:restriction endonuclease subunit S n=1 Tax=uncultured Eubacterium sp. TaxID=165185 RepID=UPI003267A4E6